MTSRYFLQHTAKYAEIDDSMHKRTSLVVSYSLIPKVRVVQYIHEIRVVGEDVDKSAIG